MLPKLKSHDYSKSKAYYEAMKGGMFMTKNSLRQLQDAIDELDIAIQNLRCIAAARHHLTWQVRSKLHRVMHMPLLAALINPMCLNCYVRESQVGASQKVWRASVRGNFHWHVQSTVLAKRWLVLLLRFELET